jgi:pseudaminic acid synthase
MGAVKRIQVEGKSIGDDCPAYFVAELSANHGQSLEKALKTVEAAARAGADAIKLQTYTPDTLTLESSEPPFIVRSDNEWAGRTLHGLYAEAMTPWDWHRPIMEAARAHGLACFSTPFDVTAAHFLAELGVPAFKIASFELVDLPLINTVARLGKPMIMSTGMASRGEIEAAVQACFDTGNRDLCLLRCTSAYPAPAETMDLRSLDLLKELGTVVGFSDHSRSNLAAIAAVCLGARLIEKHLIVDRSWGGPDAFFSLEPEEFSQLVQDVRTCEAALGKPHFGPAPEEQASLMFRRSLFLARDVEPGAVLTCDDVRSVRPGGGLPPRHLPEVLGRVAARRLRAAEPLRWDMVTDGPVDAALTLRPATLADTALLLSWRNDPETRTHSRSQAPVSVDEHDRWMAATLATTDRQLFVIERGGEPLGQLRLDLRPGSSAEISLTVAPAARGQRLAHAALQAGARAAVELSVKTLLAEIRVANERSLRAFKRAGYYGFALRHRAEGAVWICERRLAPFTA